MSTLKVANIHFEATGTNRVEYVANNINFRTGGGNFTISVGGAETLNVNASSVMISGANVLASVAAAATTANSAVQTTRNVSASGLATGGGSLAADLTITVTEASAAELRTGTEATKAVTPDKIADTLAYVDFGNTSGNTTPDYTTFFNLKFTLTGNGTLKFPSVSVADIVGRSGMIEVVQDGTGTRTLGFDVPGASGYIFDGGSTISIDTTASRITKIGYHIRSTTRIELYQTGKGVR